MNYVDQILANPALILGPVLSGALISAVVSMWIGRQSRAATSGDVDRKISAEREITDAKIAHETLSSSTERSWADYALRRDVYLDLVSNIDILFDAKTTQQSQDTGAYQKSRRDFFVTSRKVRLVGSDEVVRALNVLTASIKDHEPADTAGHKYSNLMNSIRLDIRTLNEKPPVGTELQSADFPIES